MNQREASTKNWNLFDNVSQKPTIEELNSGSLQRIADATEKMAASYDSMRNERDRYKTWYEDRGRAIDLLQRRMAALRGVITKLKKARALPLLTAFILALLASTTYGQRTHTLAGCVGLGDTTQEMLDSLMYDEFDRFDRGDYSQFRKDTTYDPEILKASDSVDAPTTLYTIHGFAVVEYVHPPKRCRCIGKYILLWYADENRKRLTYKVWKEIEPIN